MTTVAVTFPPPAEHAGTDDSADNPPGPADGPSPFSNHHADESNPVEVIWAAGPVCTVNVGWIESKLRSACAEVDQPVARITVRLVADAEMAQLHGKHAGVTGTTDVLTFDATEPGRPIDVDIAVCVDEASRRAAELGHSIERELLLYSIHGLLHCMGFDDHEPADFDRMHAEEDRLLELVGVERTFAPNTRPVNEP